MQEDYQPQQQQPYPIITPNLPTQPDDSFYTHRISSADLLDDVQHQLRGEIFVPNENGVGGTYEKMFESWLNDDGINKVLYLISSCGANRNIYLGYLEPSQINDRCNLLYKRLARMFGVNCYRYGLKKELRSSLIASIVFSIHSGLSRSMYGNEADQISTATQRVEHMNLGDRGQQNKFSLNPFSWMKK